jgi:hypothetical protein
MPIIGLSMKRDAIDSFEKLVVQLDSLHAELTMLAKKSPKDAVNEFKLKFINTVLAQCNSLFGKENRPFAEFETFSMDALPSNSDVTLFFHSISSVQRNFGLTT